VLRGRSTPIDIFCVPSVSRLDLRPARGYIRPMSVARAHRFAFRFTGPGLFQASGVAIVR
jgi:hypothetical protein